MPLPRRLPAIALAALLALPAVAQPAPGVAPATGLTEAQRQEVVALLRQALTEDPSILREALAAM